MSRPTGWASVYRARAVFRFEGSEVEPDLMVRAEAPGIGNDWERAPLPILIAEVFSATTRRRDQTYKKDFYEEAQIPEYWMVDPERREVTVFRAASKTTVKRHVRLAPVGADKPLTISVASICGSA